VLRSPNARHIRLLAPLLGALTLASALLSLAAAPAGALVVEPKAGERLGLQTREGVSPLVKPLQYHGGPVITASDTYAIYWDPAGTYHSDWMTLVDRYLHDVGAASEQLGNVFSMSTQYTGPKGTRASYKSTFRGAYTDTEPYPTSGDCVEPKGEAVCLTDAQIRAELKRFISASGLPTGVDVVYFLLTPPGVTVCTDEGGKGNCSDSTASPTEEAEGTTNGICGYHSAIEPTSTSPIVYGVQPWVAGDAGHILQKVPVKTALAKQSVLACQEGEELVEPNQTGERSSYADYETGLADVVIDDLSIEQSDIVIDPLLTGWYQEGTHAEQGDVCKGIYSDSGEPLAKAPTESLTHALDISNETINGDHYYLQWAFNSAGATAGKGVVCWSGAEAAVPHFTAPNPVDVGDEAAFDAKESNIQLDANLAKTLADEPFDAPVYEWSFGDGTPPVVGVEDASVLHSYAYGGVYDVTLTITDSGGNVTSTTNPITVIGPPPPVSTPSGSGGSSNASPLVGTVSPTLTSGSVGSSSTSKGKGGSPTSSSPKLVESVPSHSLQKALHHGLQVRYDVSEQVAGSVEMLLAATTAKQVGLSGPAAAGLPKGYPRSLIIGYAVLVTTKGGHGTLHVLIASSVARRLALLHKVKVTLRFHVHSAGRHPKTTTMLTTVVLNG
jgi:hypothetical protein